MNVTFCDICNNRIRVNGYDLYFRKHNSIFNDTENKYEICEDCFYKMTALYNKNRASVTVHIDK